LEATAVSGDAVLTEPELVPCLYSTGAAVEAGESTVRFVFWVQLPDLGGSEMEERRIQARLALPISAVMELHRELGKELGRLRRLGH